MTVERLCIQERTLRKQINQARRALGKLEVRLIENLRRTADQIEKDRIRELKRLDNHRRRCLVAKKSRTKTKPGKNVPGNLVKKKWPDLRTPAGRFRVCLRLVDPSEVIASHDPRTWLPDPRYPTETQERRYSDEVEQEKVRKIARSLAPDLLLTSTPSALDGPPIVAANMSGLLVALGGNARTMAMQLASEKPDGLAEYTRELSRLLGRKVPKNRILVRELCPSPDQKEWPKWSRDLNRSLGSGMGRVAQAISLARNLPPAVPALLAGKNLAKALSGPTGRDVLQQLQRNGLVGQSERGLFEEAGLSKEGRDLVGRALAGAVIRSAKAYEALPASVAAQLGRASANLLEASAIGGPSFDLGRAIAAAAVDFKDATAWPEGVENWLDAKHLIKPRTQKTKLGSVAMRLLTTGRIVPFSEKWLKLAESRPKDQIPVWAPVGTVDGIAENLSAAPSELMSLHGRASQSI